MLFFRPSEAENLLAAVQTAQISSFLGSVWLYLRPCVTGERRGAAKNSRSAWILSCTENTWVSGGVL